MIWLIIFLAQTLHSIPHDILSLMVHETRLHAVCHLPADGGQPDPLFVIQQDASVFFLLFLYDADLLLEVVDGPPKLFVNAVCQARHECKPEVLFHSPDRLMGPTGVCKHFGHGAAQGQLAYAPMIR